MWTKPRETARPQRQVEQDPPEQPEQPLLPLPEKDADFPSPPIPKQDGTRLTLRAPQAGQVTFAEAPGTIFSNFAPQERHSYS